MQLIGTVIFFNDEIELFKKCLDSLEGCDRIVCVDGAYQDWPFGSSFRSSDALLELVQSYSRTRLIECCSEPWPHQIQKRDAYLAGHPGDWYINIDADEEFIFTGKRDWQWLKRFLESLPDDVAWLDLEWVNPEWSYFTGRKFFKHVPGIHYDGHHAVLSDGDGNKLAPTSSLDGTDGPHIGIQRNDFFILHNRNNRSTNRLHLQGEYYRTRRHP